MHFTQPPGQPNAAYNILKRKRCLVFPFLCVTQQIRCVTSLHHTCTYSIYFFFFDPVLGELWLQSYCDKQDNKFERGP
jgi:hypothetical protein